MRRYTITVNEKAYEIDVEETGQDAFRVQVDGRLVDVRLDAHADLAQALIAPQLEVGATPVEQPAATGRTGRSAPAPRRTPRRPRSGGGSGDLTAPMPGTVVAVKVTPGAVVSAGDPVLVLEAMKMENTLRAPVDGPVTEVLVATGDPVAHGDVLMRFGGEGR